MSRRLTSVLAVGLVVWTAFVVVRTGRADGEETSPSLRWGSDLTAAYAEARRRGVPVLLAVHPRPETYPAPWPADADAWRAIYRDPRVAAVGRDFVCVKVERSALPRAALDPSAGSPLHWIAHADGRGLAMRETWPHAPGEESVRALVAWMEEALARAGGARPAEAAPPLVVPAPAPPRARETDAWAAPLRVAATAEGVRVHLGFAGRIPRLPPTADALDARVLAAWDGGTAVDVGAIRLVEGEAADDLPVDVRFRDLRPAPEQPLAPGLHRIDVWLGPAPGAYAFAEAPLPVGVVFLEVADEGDGPGGGGTPPPPPPVPEEEPSPPPSPAPEEGETPPPAPPPPERIEVVDPLVRHLEEAIEKDEAIVAVPDDDAALGPPPLVPLARALRDFERVVERAMGSERIRASDRAFLLRYFQALRASAGAEGER